MASDHNSGTTQDNRARKRRFRSHAVCDAIAGALSGCISRFAVGPFDVLKIRFQVQIEPISVHVHSKHLPKYTGIVQALTTIVKEEGITALWRGTVPGQLLTIPYTAVQFVALRRTHSLLERYAWAEKRTNLVSFISGGIAGATATICSYPFDFLRTTLAAQGEPKVYSGMVDAAVSVYRRHGLNGLYRGVGVTLIEIVPYSAIQFGSYDFLHRSLDTFKESVGIKGERTALENCLCGLVSGIVSKLTTHPLDVIKKRYQVAGLTRSLKYGERIDVKNIQSVLLSFRAVLQKEGIKGLWKGCLPNILKAGPAAAVTFINDHIFPMGIVACDNSHLPVVLATFLVQATFESLAMNDY